MLCESGCLTLHVLFFCQQVYHHINEKQIKLFLFVYVVSISSLCLMLVLACWNFFIFRLNSLICSQWQLINNCSLFCLFLPKTVDLLNCTFLKNEDLQIKLFEAFYWESSLVFPQNKMHKIITVSIYDAMVYDKILDQKMIRKRGRYIIKTNTS